MKINLKEWPLTRPYTAPCNGCYSSPWERLSLSYERRNKMADAFYEFIEVEVLIPQDLLKQGFLKYEQKALMELIHAKVQNRFRMSPTKMGFYRIGRAAISKYGRLYVTYELKKELLSMAV